MARILVVIAVLALAVFGCSGAQETVVPEAVVQPQPEPQPIPEAAETTPEVSEPTADDRELIGRWRDDAPFVEAFIEIFRQDDGLYLERIFDNGGNPFEQSLIETDSQLGRRFDPQPVTGDYYIFHAAGGLQILDNDGLIRTARPVQ